MKYARIFAVAIVAFALATPAGAKTTTWTGGDTAQTAGIAKSFVDPNNWDNGAPEPGDTVVISAESTYSNPIYIGGENGSSDTNEVFDIGSAGLTLNISSTYTKFLVNFTGSGKIVKTGGGRLGVACDSEFTGGTEVQDGNLAIFKKTLGFGTGEIDFYASESYKPILVIALSAASITNVINFTGLVDKYTVMDSGMAFTFSDDVTAEHDVKFNAKAGNVTFAKGFSAPGKTVTIHANRTTDEKAADIIINGTVDANVVKTGNKTLYLNGASSVATNTLTVSEGACEIDANGYWGGTNIAVADGAKLSLNGAGNLSPSAHLAVAEGGTIEVAKDVTVQVAALTVGDKAMPAGIYTASTLPGTVSDAGTLLVLGEPSESFFWTGEAENSLWSDVGNWQGGAVPGDGAVVYFPSATTIENATNVIIGANGLSLVLGGDVTLNHGFAGSGALRISGGAFYLRANVVFSHTGGTTLSGNIRFDMGTPQSTKDAFGTGVLTIDGMSGGSPFIRFVNWAQTITNDIVIVGAVTNRTYSHKGRTVRGSVVDFNAGYISGSVTGDDDVMFGTGYGSLHVRGNVTVPEGKTIRLQNAYVSEETPRYLEVTKTLTGNLSVEGVGLVRLTKNATCTGDVSVRNTATLELTAAGNLAETAVVSILDGGQIDIASSVRIVVAELWVDGVKQANGVYRASDLPDVISGSGSLRVGPKTGFTIIVM